MEDVKQSRATLKNDLRARLREQSALALTNSQRSSASEAICRTIRQTRAWQQARLVCAFLPMKSEPDIRLLWADENGPAFCFPRQVGSEIELIRVGDRTLLAQTDWRLAAPAFDSCPRADFTSVDLILVPGVAFTPDGHRLGRGAGFYDRLLERRTSNQRTLGVCFHHHLLPDLPTEAHDQRVERVITELSDS
jgi:5-formyltetrahydrofolate cyclo-ligase